MGGQLDGGMGGIGKGVPFWEFCEVEEGRDVENEYCMWGGFERQTREARTR